MRANVECARVLQSVWPSLRLRSLYASLNRPNLNLAGEFPDQTTMKIQHAVVGCAPKTGESPKT